MRPSGLAALVSAKRRRARAGGIAFAPLVVVAALALVACGGTEKQPATPTPFAPTIVESRELIRSQPAADVAQAQPALVQAVSPDGLRVVLPRFDQSRSGQVYLACRDGFEARLLGAGDRPALGWSPDGAKVAVGGGDARSGERGFVQLAVIDLATTESRELLAMPTGSSLPSAEAFWFAGWAPDSQHIYYLHLAAGEEPDLWRVNVQTAERQRLYELPMGAVSDVNDTAFSAIASPDGRWLAVTRSRSDEEAGRPAVGWWLIHVESGAIREVPLPEPGPRYFAAGLSTMVWRPDSQGVAYMASYMPTDGGEPISGLFYASRRNPDLAVALVPGGTATLGPGLSFSPDSLWLAASVDEQITAFNVEREESRQLTMDFGVSINPFWTPLGDILYEYWDQEGHALRLLVHERKFTPCTLP